LPTVRGLAPARLGVDGTSYDLQMSGAARRTSCLLPRLASRGWEPVLFVSQASAPAFRALPGVTVVPLRTPAHPAPLRRLLARRPMEEAIRELGITLFLTEIPPAPEGLPFVLNLHDTRAFDRPETLRPGRRLWLRRTLPEAVARAAAVIVPSAATAERVEAWFPQARPRVVPNGGDHFPVALRPPAREDFLLAVGPWDRRKNLPLLLEAHRRLAPRPPLVLAGLRRRPRGAAPEVEVGRPDDLELAGLYRRAAVTVCPSDWEGFGLPLAEALAQACPVVASDLPAHREVGGAAVRYFPSGSVEGLVRALEEVRRRPPSPALLLQQAGRHPWRLGAEALDQVLRQVAARAWASQRTRRATPVRKASPATRTRS